MGNIVLCLLPEQCTGYVHNAFEYELFYATRPGSVYSPVSSRLDHRPASDIGIQVNVVGQSRSMPPTLAICASSRLDPVH